MKKIFLALLVTGAAIAVSAQTSKKKTIKKTEVANEASAPKVIIASKDSMSNLKWNETKHDFGKLPQGIPVTYTFKFVNANPSPVTITNAKASCGCTTPNWSKEPIASGGTGVITVSYNSASVGVFNKTVNVSTNLGSIVLYITGVVEPKAAEPAPTPIRIGG